MKTCVKGKVKEKAREEKGDPFRDHSTQKRLIEMRSLASA